MKTIQYVSAPAGSGKTYSLAHHAAAEVKAHKKVLIAQPTKRLIRQTARQIRAVDPTANIKITTIYGEDYAYEAVAARVQTHIDQAAPNNGEILLNAVLDPDQLVCVRSDSYTDLLTNPTTLGHMDFFAILTDPFVDGFNEVTLMGANAEHSELMVLWQKILPNVEFTSHPILTANLRYATHTNGHRLTISYLFDKWSKRYAESGPEDETILKRTGAIVEGYMDGRSFLWQANKNVSDGLFDPKMRLPHRVEGLDDTNFTAVHNVVLLSALNRSNADYAFLALLGVDNHIADITLGYQSDYQTIMRCSLRDPKAIAPVEVIVASKKSADWLAQHFPGCTVKAIDHSISGPQARGRPTKPSAGNSTERSRKRRALLKAGQP
jgi:hypothetical protein